MIFSLIQPCLSYRDPLVGRDSIISLADGVGAQAFDSISRQIANDPYNPGSFAWGWQYHARGCLIMFNLTGNRKWLDWAVNISDHFLAYSDVNGDGEPAWGNYNETWGNDRYDFREYTVWDGVIGLPIIETAKVILGNDALSDNETLRSKANAYVDLMERVVQRHHGSWNQVDTDQGYYWDDPYEDVGPIVNRFTALGRVELVLGDVTSNTSYYEKPGQMANYMIANMRYDSDDDLYTWEYKYGEEGSEDISHGAIELEFLIMANQRGLLEDVHLERLANTYLKRIWQLPQILDGKKLLSMKVDGTDYPQYDYSSISRGWALLAPYSPEVFESQRIVFGVIHEKRGMYASSVNLLGLAQIPLMAGSLEAQGTDPDSIRVVDLATIESMYDRALGRLNETMSLGSEAISVISLIDESAQHLNQNSLYNASIPGGLLYRAWEMLSRIEQTGLKLRDLVEGIEEAEELGVS
ncbi:MAG: hypothetical protein HXS50_02810, partial [Theionarchaea archaeon]|nr:hypothetical protein [Theionarchaea archaeon]